MIKRISIIIAILLCIALCSCTLDSNTTLGESEDILPAKELSVDFVVPEDFKIGFIFLHDANSTYDYNFIKASETLAALLGLTEEQILMKTNIPEANACYDAAIELADAGCDIVFADSFGHESFILQAAKDRPNVQFCHATGVMAHTAQVQNFHDAFANIYEGRYCAGVAAGMKLNEMIENGTIKAEEAIIGYIGAFPYAEVISGMTSFFLGARSICKSATMKVRYVGSWYDQSLEAEAAQALINNDNCVIISQHADSLGAPSACELLGIPNVSYNGSTYDAGPSSFLISSAINWTPYFLYIVRCTIIGEQIAYDWCGGIEEGSIVLSGINQDIMAKGTIEKLNEVIGQFKEGQLKVFDTENFTVNGEHLNEYLADVDGDYVGETNVIHDGYFDESSLRAAPYFDIIIDGVTILN